MSQQQIFKYKHFQKMYFLPILTILPICWAAGLVRRRMVSQGGATPQGPRLRKVTCLSADGFMEIYGRPPGSGGTAGGIISDWELPRELCRQRHFCDATLLVFVHVLVVLQLVMLHVLVFVHLHVLVVILRVLIQFILLVPSFCFCRPRLRLDLFIVLNPPPSIISIPERCF